MAESSTITSTSEARDLTVEGRTVILRWEDGRQTELHAIWLRDNCPCPECRHETTGQRLLDTATIPADIGIERGAIEGDALEVVWTGDGHAGRYPLTWLRKLVDESASGSQTQPNRMHWDAALADRLPSGTYNEVRTSPAALRDWLAAADAYGFAILHGVPTEPGTIFRVVELFGYVRETNYGRLFDVRSVVNPTNLAFTGLALGAHTDNPYRDPTPTLQLLHCLSSSVSGGDNTLVDGIRVGEELRTTDPEAFDLLSTVPIRFHYRDGRTDLSTWTTIIGVSPSPGGYPEITSIHFNNRSKAPLMLEPGTVEPFYAAYRTFAVLLADPRFEIQISLAPGDVLLMDNTRVLHGRTGYSSAEGERHLQGCYADRDGLRSALAVLSRSGEPVA